LERETVLFGVLQKTQTTGGYQIQTTVRQRGLRFVEQERWLDEQAYGRLVALSQFLPGPGSSQVGFALGYRRSGIPGAIAAFRHFCAGNDWQPAFYQTLPDGLSHYRASGMETVCIGQEAIVRLGGFSLEGKAGKPLRNVMSRMDRLGYRSEVHTPPLGDELLSELREISDEWLTSMRTSEQRFSLGWFDDEYVRSSAVITALSGEGQIVAFANIVPEYQRSEATVDLMRRRRQMENGTDGKTSLAYTGHRPVFVFTQARPQYHYYRGRRLLFLQRKKSPLFGYKNRGGKNSS